MVKSKLLVCDKCTQAIYLLKPYSSSATACTQESMGGGEFASIHRYSAVEEHDRYALPREHAR